MSVGSIGNGFHIRPQNGPRKIPGESALKFLVKFRTKKISDQEMKLDCLKDMTREVNFIDTQSSDIFSRRFESDFRGGGQDCSLSVFFL